MLGCLLTIRGEIIVFIQSRGAALHSDSIEGSEKKTRTNKVRWVQVTHGKGVVLQEWE